MLLSVGQGIDLASLHHETGDDSLENTVLVVTVATQLTGAKSSEVLNCPWDKFLEELDHDFRSCVAFVFWRANLKFNEALNVVFTEGGERFERRTLLLVLSLIHI